MPQTFFIDFAIILVVALIGGLVAHRLGMPTILGFMVGGILIGPGTPGFVIDAESVATAAALGVTLLMFAVGVEFSLHGLAQVRGVAVVGGLIGIALTALIGYGAGRLLGWDWYASLYLGLVITNGATLIVLRLLGDRGELQSRHGQVMIGTTIVQDLAVIVFVALLPALYEFDPGNVGDVLQSLGVAFFLLAGTTVLAVLVVPHVLRLVAGTQRKDLVILTATAIAIGSAVGTSALGLSPALGAFLAGLIISESEYSHEVLAEVVPLRDVFASIFFVSIGVMFEPARLLAAPGGVVLVTAAVILGKGLVIALIVRAFGYHLRVALLTGVGLAQIGEFSFVMAQLGLQQGLVSDEFYSLVISAAIVTIFLTPFLFQGAARLADRIPHPLGSWPAPADRAALREHIIICGYGRVGKQVGTALERFEIPYAVVDYDPHEVRRLTGRGIPAVYGDATRREVLEQIYPRGAISAVVTLPDAAAAEVAIGRLRAANPRLPVVARGHAERDLERLYAAGADEVVQAEWEAGLEVVRHALLHHTPVDNAEVDDYLDAVRHARYHQEALPRAPGDDDPPEKPEKE